VKTLIKYLVAVFVAGLTSLVHAQLLEDVALRRDGPNAVVQVRFVLQVRLQRVVATGSEDLAQVLYDVVDLGGLRAFNAKAGQRRVLSGGDGIPRLTVTDDEVIGNTATRKLGVRFDRPVRFNVRTGPGDRTIEIVLEGLGGQVALPTPVAPAPLAPDTDKRYLITLLSSRDPNVQMEMPVPGALQEYQVFTDRRSVGGQPLYEINLGYFTTLPEAEQARSLLLRRFPKAVVVSLSDRSAAPAPAVATMPAAPAASAPPRTAQATPAASTQVQTKAAQLMATAKSALDAKDIDGSIQALNLLLDLPANTFSREAQELVGFVRMRAGDTARARTEFELFLKLYPNGPDADRVRQKLASLPKPSTDPKQPGGERRQAAATPPSTTLSGSLSARYFELRDKTDDRLLGNGVAPAFVVDARSADTNADFNLRYRDADRDARLVFNDSYTTDLLNNNRNRNRLNSLYADYRSFSWGTNIRLGRQSPSGGGVFGRFDGVQAGYAFIPKWRLNAVGGVQVDQPFASKSKFFGMSLDAEALSANLSGSLYAVTDITDNLTDRRAFGAELRYFNGGVSASTSIDYDQFINAINFASLQASWQLPSNTTFNALFEARAQNGFVAANQGLSIALVGQPVQSLNKLEDLVKLVGEDAVRKVVRDTTGYTTQFLLGATTPISKNWQLGGDVRLTNVGAIDPIDPIIVGGPFEFGGFAGSGNVVTLSTQLIGSNIYSRRDTHVFNVSLILGELANAVALSYNNSSAIGESFLLEPSLRFFFQDSVDQAGLRIKSTSLTPGLRLSYQVTRHISLDADLNYEYRREKTADNDVTTNSVFYILGGRFDF
jgi:hypothetical protein